MTTKGGESADTLIPILMPPPVDRNTRNSYGRESESARPLGALLESDYRRGMQYVRVLNVWLDPNRVHPRVQTRFGPNRS